MDTFKHFCDMFKGEQLFPFAVFDSVKKPSSQDHWFCKLLICVSWLEIYFSLIWKPNLPQKVTQPTVKKNNLETKTDTEVAGTTTLEKIGLSMFDLKFMASLYFLFWIMSRIILLWYFCGYLMSVLC